MTIGFERAREGLRATGASVSTYEVVEALDRHGREEAELLERYGRFIAEAKSPAARYLVQLIVDDEQRHHRILEELANTIAWGSLGGQTEVVPALLTADRDLRAETRALLRHEVRDRTQLRRLRKRLRSYGEANLWGLLVDLMRSDTEKHIDILRFILRNSSRRPLEFPRFFQRVRRHNRVLPG